MSRPIHHYGPPDFMFGKPRHDTGRGRPIIGLDDESRDVVEYRRLDILQAIEEVELFKMRFVCSKPWEC